MEINKEIEALKNRIGYITISIEGSATLDNLANLLCGYFQDHPSRPDDDTETEHGWGKWVEDMADQVLHRIAATCSTETASHIEYMRRVNAEITEHMNDVCCWFSINNIVTRAEVKGQRDEYTGFFNHVYVDQFAGLTSDMYRGTIYFPLGDGDYYVSVAFES